MTKRTTPTRAGRTEKISISVDRQALATLRRRAKDHYAGNLSAVIAEGVRRVQEEEDREALVAWLGRAGEASPAEREAIIAEWLETPAPRRRTRRSAA